MGEAKRRGTQEQRQQAAIAANRAKFPDVVECNACHAELSEIVPFDTRGIPGLRLAGGAHCGCGNITYVIDGTPDAVARLQEVLAEEHGGAPKVGTAPKPA
jgi:hypothetical protein